MFMEFWGFRKMLTPSIIAGIYFLGFLLLIFFGFALMVGEDTFWVGLAVLIGGNVLLRIICESWILFFSIHEVLVSTNKSLTRIEDITGKIENMDEKMNNDEEV